MKNIFYVFVVLNLLFTSCSDNETTAKDNLILPKTITVTFPDFPQDNSKSTYTYDGNKIVNIIDARTKTIFTYEGNLIVKQEVYNIELLGLETLKNRVVYEYENNKLKTRVFTSNFDSSHPNGDYIRKEVYIYKPDGVISYSQIDVNVLTKFETKRGDVNLTYKSGNLIQYEEINIDPKIPITVFTFEYDNKNNPLINILGFDLLYYDGFPYSKNNDIKTTRKDSSAFPPAVYNSTFTYNIENYPTKYISYTSDGKTIEYVTEYTY